MNNSLSRMLEDIRRLSETTGGRGSCTPGEHQAGEYAAEQLRQLGLQDVQIEQFLSIPSTYWPFGLAFAAALTGSLISLIYSGAGALLLGALFNGLGLWAMLAETEFASSWTHWILPKLNSQNVTARIPPSGQVKARAVLCAHIDSHRTPVFYSSNTWYILFSALIALTFLSMLVGTVGFSLGALLSWQWVRWLGLLVGVVQVFALGMCLHADFTPFSPGANDNASGVAVTLALAQQLLEKPLAHTEVHLALTGCEEVGAYGMAAYLEAHAGQLGPETVYIILDQVGAGRIKFLTADGLLLKHKTHPQALELARDIVARKPGLKAYEGVGLAYTDALRATKRGLIALTLCTVPADEAQSGSNWHQMTDTLEHVIPEDLEKTYQFTLEILQSVGRGS
jgi:Peptidase family M28